MSQVWSHGLFGCFSDITTCLITWLIPCYTAGKNAEAVGESCLIHAIYFFLPLINWYCHATVRGKIRDKKGIDGTFFNDLLLSIFCELCALVQESMICVQRNIEYGKTFEGENFCGWNIKCSFMGKHSWLGEEPRKFFPLNVLPYTGLEQTEVNEPPAALSMARE